MSPYHGLHHVTAVAGDPRRNYRFYSELLGLKLVKKTVNFDDPTVYHLYYGDRTGSPGTILSFFPDSSFAPGDPGIGQAVAVSFAVPDGSLEFWQGYLSHPDRQVTEPFERFDKKVLGLQDPDGLHIELVETGWAGETGDPEDSAIPAEHAIRGLHGVTLAVDSADDTAAMMKDLLGFEQQDREEERNLYTAGSGPGSAVEILDGVELDGGPGRGTIHHIAFRAADAGEQEQMRQKLAERGYHVTGSKDRVYFQSIYFHEPGGVLCEISTDTPGFLIDEPADRLGKKLTLPPWLETRRSEIEQTLSEIKT